MTAPFSSPASREALELIKAHIIEHAPPGFIDDAALRVLGGTDAEVEIEIQKFVLALVEALRMENTTEAVRVALPVAAGFVIRDRLAETRRFVSEQLEQIRGGV